MNTNRTSSGQIGTKLLRRTAVMAAGLAIIVGGFLAATPAKAQDELKVTATSEVNKTTIAFTGCYEGRDAFYTVHDASGKNLTPDSFAVPGWDQDEDFSFVHYPRVSGTLTVKVTCQRDGISGGDISATTTFTTTLTPSVLIIAPERWKTGDQVTLSVTGLIPGEEASINFGVPGGQQPLEVWSPKANAAGTARVSVTWPKVNSTGQYQMWVWTKSHPETSVKLTLGANSQWNIGSAPTGDTGTDSGSDGGGGGDSSTGSGGKLPKTGD